MSPLQAAPSGPASFHSLSTRNRYLLGELGTSSFCSSFADFSSSGRLTGDDECESFGALVGHRPIKQRLKAQQRPGDRVTFRGCTHMNQQEIPLVGSVTRPMHRHPATELRACRRKGQACRLSLIHSGDAQETVAERIGITPGYLSMLLSGKRRWNDDLQRKFERVTGSWAPFQWDAIQRGVDLHFDPVNVARATGEYLVEQALAA